MQIQESDFTEKIIPTENERIRPPQKGSFLKDVLFSNIEFQWIC